MRIFEVTVTEVIIDPEGASEKLAATLERGGENGSAVAGMCSDNSTVFLSIVPASVGEAGVRYRFAQLVGAAAGTFDMESAIMARHYAGFTAIGSFSVGNGSEIWALFAQRPEEGGGQ